MSRHAIVVNTGKPGVVEGLRTIEPDLEIQVVTEESYVGMYAGDHVGLHLVGDVGDVSTVLGVVRSLVDVRPVDVVVSPSERSVPTGGYLRSMLGLPGPGFEVALRFSHKGLMKAALQHAGLPVADHRVVQAPVQVEAAATALGWPVVLKPTLGTGSMNTTVLRSPADLAALWFTPVGAALARQRSPLVVERFVDMRAELHCDGVVVDGEVLFDAVQRYFMPLLGRIDDFTGSYVLPHNDGTAEEVRKLHRRAIEALGLRDGVTHLEVFETADGLVVGEIACRPAGGGIPKSVDMQYGVDLWDAYLRLALGHEPEVTAQRRDGLVVNCDLPVRPGRITRISTAEELAALSGVVGVQMAMSVGDTIGARLHSASTTGLVFLTVADEAELEERLAELRAAYVLTTAPAD